MTDGMNLDAATISGIVDTARNPEEAIARLRAAYPALDAEKLRVQFEFTSARERKGGRLARRLGATAASAALGTGLLAASFAALSLPLTVAGFALLYLGWTLHN